MEEKIMLSVIKADVGCFVGHSAMHPELKQVTNTKYIRYSLVGSLLVD